MINALHVSRDNVIRSAFVSGNTNFQFALESLAPLLDRFGEQRKAQNKTFYDRLRSDIISGCIMPPITIAFVSEEFSKVDIPENLQEYINANIAEGYILDGMQRLLTLVDASKDAGFDAARPLYVNVIIAERYDFLLYRMITLNNGQKPMTARHQIEMLTKGAIDISEANLNVVREKQTEGTKVKHAFRMSDIAEAYTAYLSNSLHNQNSKIIESKLDEILVGKVMEAGVNSQTVSFSEILAEVGRLIVIDENKDWLRQLNNLIGFTVAAKKSLLDIRSISPEHFRDKISIFEAAFKAMNASKLNVGKYRRELSKVYFEKIAALSDYDQSQLEALFFAETLSE